MAQQNIPASPTYRYTHYSSLKGIDLTCDVTQTPRFRASDLLNMIPDIETGNPRKRHGWRVLKTFPTGTKFLGSRHISEWGIDLLATSDGVYTHDASDGEWETDPTKIIDKATGTWNNVAFIGFDSNGDYRLNIFGRRYKLTNDSGTITVTRLYTDSGSYVPTTVISRDPDGNNGYAYEAVNAFTPERKIQFLSWPAEEYDSSSRYTKGDYAIHSDTLYKCKTNIDSPEAWNSSHWTAKPLNYYFYPRADRPNHFVYKVLDVKIRNTNGDWRTATYGTDYSIIYGSVTADFYTSEPFSNLSGSYTKIIGITLTAVSSPVVPGQDNIIVHISESAPYYYPGTTIYEGSRSSLIESILTKNTVARYGMTSMDREFYATNNGRIYYTDPDNYDYLPDNNYIQTKIDSTIVGFHRKNSYLVAITENTAENTIYMISGATTSITHTVINETGVSESETEDFTYFVARTAVTGTGAVARKALATLVDDTLFLSHRGIYGITSNTVTSETVIANRSELINPKLVKEPDMDKACAAIWQGMYVLSFPTTGHVYVLDPRSTHQNKGVSYGYECYYLDNICATDFLSYDGNLFFGDTNKNWCRFNTDINNATAYEDNGILDENGGISGGDAIYARYAFTLDSDGYPQYLKTLNKRGTSIELMQLPNSGVRLSYSKDGTGQFVVNDIVLEDRFTWTLVDFEDFSFNASGVVRTYYPKKKIKKYKYLQFVLESDKIDQNFGICAITKTYFIGNFAKR